jgi:glyoxalase family protein
MQLRGIHHVTAVTGHAAANLAFYTEVLGMRLVKKTVNQDDVSAYHLFYADEIGHPGTDLTFFDWPDAIPGRPGTGTIAATGLRVPGAALDWWAQRFETVGVRHEGIVARAGRRTLAFADPEGQRLQLVDTGDFDYGAPWDGSPVPTEKGIKGLGPVTLEVARAEPTMRVLVQVLSFREVGEYVSPEDGEPVRVFATGEGGPGAEVHLAVRPDHRRGAVGIGGVHHVAFRTPDKMEQEAWRAQIASSGLAPTPLIDRFYFSSVYFREPGGVLFEIATDGPGFAADEDPAHLGESLALPPFLEPYRAAIEAGLRPLPPVHAGAGIEIRTSESLPDAPQE